MVVAPPVNLSLLLIRALSRPRASLLRFLLIVGLAHHARSAAADQTSIPAVAGDDRVRLRSVEVLPSHRTVAATGWVNQVAGPIELLACGPGGKTHESVFVLAANPVDLQAGLLLLGLRPGTPLPTLGAGPPEGTGLEIWVDWRDDGASRSERAERFVFNTESGSALPPIEWIFTGSIFEGGQFKALAEESLVATYWDPWAIFNIPLPCGSNDEILVVHRELCPKQGTPVRFRFKVP